MKKYLIPAISFFITCISFSCATTRMLPVVDEGVDRLIDISELRVDYFNVNGDPKMVGIMNNALSAMMDQEWESAIDYLNQGNEAVTTGGRNIFFHLLD